MRIPAVLSLPLALTALFAAAMPASASPKACDLLNAQAAASLVGGPVQAPIDMGGVICGYSAQSGDNRAGLTITGPPPAGVNLKNSIGRAVDKGNTFEVIPGLGEQAVLLVKDGHDAGMTVIYGQKFLILTVERPMTPALKSAMIQTMKQIISKL